MATKSYQFLFDQSRVGGVTNTMREFISSGVEISDTARNAASWGATNTALAAILTLQGFGATVAGGAFAVGTLYEVVTTGTTNFTLVGAAASTPGTVFRATGVGTGTGTVRRAEEHNVLEGFGRLALAVAPGYSGTGNGTMTNVVVFDSVGVAEVWTITATSATNFTVTGSVSGAKAAATVGVPYNNGIISFIITAGVTPFVATDAFTQTVTRGVVLDTLVRDGIKVTSSIAAVQTALSTPVLSLL